MDNASTSFPKAPGVGLAMARYVEEVGANVSRGGYAAALEAEDTALRLRESLCRMFNAPSPECCILTPGATYGLNMILKGFLRPGDRVVVSGLEHNAVMRPLSQLAGVDVAELPCAGDGTVHPDDLRLLLTVPTRLVCVTWASNVCGTVLPVEALGEICREAGVPFVADASQAVGHLPLDFERARLAAMVFGAHKGLLGPQGIGAALLRRDFAESLVPFVTGGTGSRSDSETQPSFLPDKLEAGTPNLPGMYGWLATLDYVEEHAASIRTRERELTRRFLEGVEKIPGVRLVGRSACQDRLGVISLDFVGRDNGVMAALLAEQYGIATRSGLHCAPRAHRSLGTYPRGTVRFSLGFRTSEQDVRKCLEALKILVSGGFGK